MTSFKLKFLTFLMILVCSSAYSQTYVNKIWKSKYLSPIDSIPWGNSSTFDTLGNLVVVGTALNSAETHTAIVTTKLATDGTTIWTKSFQVNSSENAYGIKVKDYGSYTYVLGTNHSSSNGYDMVLIKYDNNGNVNWSATYNGTNNKDDVPVDFGVGDNGIYVTGYTTTNSAGKDVFIRSYSAVGSLNWSNTYNYNNYDDIPGALAIDNSGHIYVACGTSNSTTNREYTILKYSMMMGTLEASVRESTTGSSLDMPVAIKLYPNMGSNDIIITGDANNSTGSSPTFTTIRYSSTLSKTWSATFDGSGNYNEVHGMEIGDGIYVMGFQSRQDGRDAIVIKYNFSGSELWHHVYVPDNSGDNTSMVAFNYSSIDNSIYCLSNIANTQNNAVTYKINTNGDIVWLQMLAYSTSDWAKGFDIKVNPLGDVFTSGIYGATGGENYVSAEYQTYTMNKVPVYNANGTPVFVKDQVIIQFQPDILNSKITTDNDHPFATPAEFLPSTVLSDLESQLGFSLSSSKMVKVCPNFTPSDNYSISRLGDTVEVPDVWNLVILTLPTDLDIDSVRKHLSTCTSIRHVHQNWYGVYDDSANDPRYRVNQGALHILPDSSNKKASINIEDAWHVTAGKSYINVGVYDNGVDWARKDFHVSNDTFWGTGKVLDGYDYYNHLPINKENPKVYAGFHGTPCAGIIGALRNNNKLIAGITGGDMTLPIINNDRIGCPLYAMKFGDTALTIDEIVNATMEGAYSPVNPNPNKKKNSFGLHVMSNSWGFSIYDIKYPYAGRSSSTDFPPPIHNAVGFAYMNKVVYVAARGNSGDDIDHYPATFHHDDWIISVSASETDGEFKHDTMTVNGTFHNSNITDATGFTYKGYGSSYGKKLDLIAPGTAKLVTSLRQLKEDTIKFTNSSSACPHVSGVSALMLSAWNTSATDPGNLSPEDVQNILKFTATDKTTAPSTTGYDMYSGYGLLNAAKAVRYVQKPDFSILHFTAKSSLGHAKKINDSIGGVINLDEKFKYNTHDSLMPGFYNTDIYAVTDTVSYSAPSGYKLINAWVRGSSSSTIDRAESNFLDTPVYIHNYSIVPSIKGARMDWFTSTHASIVGYVYHFTEKFRYVGHDALGAADSIDAWVPFNPFTTKANFAYSLHIQSLSSIEKQKETEKLQAKVYPNPANHFILLQYHVPENEFVNLDVVDIDGRLISVLLNSNRIQGDYTERFDLDLLKPGIYIFRLKLKDQVIAQKFIKE